MSFILLEVLEESNHRSESASVLKTPWQTHQSWRDSYSFRSLNYCLLEMFPILASYLFSSEGSIYAYIVTKFCRVKTFSSWSWSLCSFFCAKVKTGSLLHNLAFIFVPGVYIFCKVSLFLYKTCYSCYFCPSVSWVTLRQTIVVKGNVDINLEQCNHNHTLLLLLLLSSAFAFLCFSHKNRKLC